MIYGLDEKKDSDELKGGGNKPDWAPKVQSNLGNNKYLVDIVLLRMKVSAQFGLLIKQYFQIKYIK